MKDEFFTLHQGLDREGPGEPAGVTWAAEILNLSHDARICDAGCGPGADIPSLLEAAPEGHVTAVDSHKPFIDELLERAGDDPRLTAYAGDMAKVKGPFDLIWCMGALYFLGIERGLRSWRPALANGGGVAFSEPCFFASAPSEAARAFWGLDTPVTDAAGIAAQVEAAGYETVATRRLPDTAWDAYYIPMESRIAELKPTAGKALKAVLEEGRAEIDTWRSVKGETGYLLCLARPA